MTHVDHEADFLALLHAQPRVRQAFDNAVTIQLAAWRRRDPDKMRDAGAAFARLCDVVEQVEGLPVIEPARRVLLEFVAHAIEMRRRGNGRLN